MSCLAHGLKPEGGQDLVGWWCNVVTRGPELLALVSGTVNDSPANGMGIYGPEDPDARALAPGALRGDPNTKLSPWKLGGSPILLTHCLRQAHTLLLAGTCLPFDDFVKVLREHVMATGGEIMQGMYAAVSPAINAALAVDAVHWMIGQLRLGRRVSDATGGVTIDDKQLFALACDVFVGFNGFADRPAGIVQALEANRLPLDINWSSDGGVWYYVASCLTRLPLWSAAQQLLRGLPKDPASVTVLSNELHEWMDQSVMSHEVATLVFRVCCKLPAAQQVSTVRYSVVRAPAYVLCVILLLACLCPLFVVITLRGLIAAMRNAPLLSPCNPVVATRFSVCPIRAGQVRVVGPPRGV